MTLTAAIRAPHPDQIAHAGPRIARVEVATDLAAVAPIWHRLEAEGLSTPYQRFALQAAWQRHVGVHDGVTPLIAIGFDAQHQPLVLLPLVVRSENGVRVARFFGGKHVTFNMPLWQRDFAASAVKDDLDVLLQGIRSHGGADLLALIRQPRRWLGLANPMALLPHQISTNDCPVLTMVAGDPPVNRISNSFRRRLKGKERKLQALPGYGYQLATTPAEIERTLDAFFAIKPLRMAEQKLPNVFAEPGVEAFIREACAEPVAGGHAIEVHALRCDDEVIAMFAGVADAHRFSMMFNTYTMSANSKYSPGLILMRDIIDHYAERGTTSLDLGIGSDDYKRLFCKGDEPIFDSYLPLSARGAVAAVAMSSLTHAKRLVKQTPALMQMAQLMRSVLQRQH